MNNYFNSDVKRYFHEIKSLLPLRGRNERDLLHQLKQQILQIAEQHESITYDELSEHFGQPGEILETYYSTADCSYLTSKLKNRKIIFRSISVILVLLLITGSLKIMWNIKRVQDLEHERYILYHTQESIQNDQN